MSQSPKEKKTALAEEVQNAVVPITSAKEKTEMKNTDYRVDALVDSLWDGYAATVSQAQKFLESGENAYLLAIQELFKSNEEYRRQVEELKELTQPDLSSFKGFLSFWKKEDEKAKAQTEQLENLFQEVTKKLGEIAWNPWKFAVDFVEVAEKRFEENSQELVKALREQRKTFTSLNDQFVSLAKKSHRTFLRSLEDAVRPFVTAQ